jgi:hypothetical protein
MGKMLQIDEDAIANAFAFDTDAFGGIDFAGALGSGLDLGSMSMEMPEFPSLDVSVLLNGLEASDLPIAGLASFAVATLSDYLSDRAPAFEEDAEAIIGDFAAYLGSPEGQLILAQTLPYAVDLNGLSSLVGDIIGGFMSDCAGAGINDPDAMIAYFPTWLEENADWILPRADALLDVDSLMSMAMTLVGSYLDSRGLSLEGMVGSIGEDFMAWLADPDVSAEVTAQFAANVNLDSLIAKVSASLGSYLQEAMSTFMRQFMSMLTSQITEAMTGAMGQISDVLADAFNFDSDLFSSAFVFNMSQEELGQLMLSMMGMQRKTYESNLKLLGYADIDQPSNISIYPRDFESKQAVLSILDAYNERMEQAGLDEKVVVYTDYVGALMSSVTDIIDMISMVLVAFVAISLIVSSIMIGIVTYISVLERKKEIGILRSIGASKQDIGNVFNAETLIIGLGAGIMGILLTALGCIPANYIVEASLDVHNIAILPLYPSLALIGISCILSFVAGLIPSAAASRRDPVEALRSE